MTREQELKLIDLGIQKLLEAFKEQIEKIPQRRGPYKTGRRNYQIVPKLSGRKWTAQQRRKFRATMKKVWEEKRKKAAQ